ncbi:MAG: ABC transporter permease [Burkholderiales bacterium]|nr:ABC transporter permease [Burkholderiales bacterium]
MNSNRFSPSRWLGIVIKEFIQLKRDRLTFAMIVGIPIVQLLLFGFAINTDPRQLPTAIVMADPGPFTRAYVAAMTNSDYFRIVGQVDEQAADRMLDRGDVQFVVTFAPGFNRELVRGHMPTLLVEADATDPLATAGAISVLTRLGSEVFNADLPGARPAAAASAGSAIDLRVHRRYNPEGSTAHNVVPGLLGVILTMTMVLMTGLAMTRERERGTFENLLATPATPLEVMTGKIVPYIAIGLVQVSLILLAARWIFDVPMQGSLGLLYAVVLLFICANLTLGITFSTIARNQLQAMQMTFFFFLPSILLSGFMFPFRGMPEWAQWIGSALPLTHFMVLVRGILLKGNGLALLWGHLWPILAFTVVVLAIGLRKFRRTLD